MNFEIFGLKKSKISSPKCTNSLYCKSHVPSWLFGVQNSFSHENNIIKFSLNPKPTHSIVKTKLTAAQNPKSI